MTNEKELIKQYNITQDNIIDIFKVFKDEYNFKINDEELLDVFVIPLNEYDFRYATKEEVNTNGCLALTKEEYFDFIREKIKFISDLNGITTI